MIIRAMAEAERMMDAGTLPYVMAPSPNGKLERFAVNQEVMDDLGLVKGQTVNTMIMDAIIEASLDKIKKVISDTAQKIEDMNLNPDFDFLDMMDKDDNND